MTSSYRGYVKAPGSLDSFKKPDRGQKILKRNQEYLDDLREIRKFERAQEASAYNQYLRNQDASLNINQKNFELENRFAQIAQQQLEENTRKSQAAMEKAFALKRQQGGPGLSETLEFITNFSKTAANAYQGIREANIKNEQAKALAAQQQGIRNQLNQGSGPSTDSLFSPMNFMRLANNVPFSAPEDTDSIAGSQAYFNMQESFYQNQAATAASFEVSNDPVAALNVYNSADAIINPIVDEAQQRLAVKRQAVYQLSSGAFNIQTMDGGTKNWQDMSVQERMDPYNYMQAYRQAFNQMGIDIRTMDNNRLAILVNEMDKAAAPYFKSEIDDTLSAYKNNAVSNAWSVFQAEPTPINANAAYMALHRLTGGDDKAAREKWFDALGDLGYADTDVQNALEAKIPGRNESWAQAFPGEVQDLLLDRSNKQIEVAQAQNDQREIQDLNRAEQLIEQGAENMEQNGGVYTLAGPEELKGMILEMEAQGQSKSAAALRKFLPKTSSAQNTERLVKYFDELLYNGIEGDITKDMIIESSLPDDKKGIYLGKVKEFDAVAPSADDADAAETYMADSLKTRVKYSPTGTKAKDPSINEALRFAVQKYNQVYRNARLEGKSRIEAQTIAIKDFEEDFGTNKTEGRYATSDINEGETSAGYKNFQTMRTSYDRIDGSFPMAKIDIELNNDPTSILTKPLLPKEFLQQVTPTSLKTDGMPAAIQHIAQRHSMPAFEILNAQLGQAGLPTIPAPIYEAAKETTGVVAPELQNLLNQYPSYTRTDIAMVGSGQEPIYTTSTPMQERVKAIFSARESPNAGYDAINRGNPGDTPGGATARYGKPLTQMTVGQVKQLQAKELNAVGKYQFIEKTLRQAAVDAGVTDDMLFNEAVQDRIFFVHLDKYGAYKPWEKWWIQQGGQGLALTAEEKKVIEAFRNAYDPSNPWRQPKNLNPAVLQALPTDSSIEGGVDPLDLEAMGISTTPIE